MEKLEKYLKLCYKVKGGNLKVTKEKIEELKRTGRLRFLSLEETEEMSRNERMLQIMRKEASERKPYTIVPCWDNKKRKVRFFGVNQKYAE